jgi:hypothetical protein
VKEVFEKLALEDHLLVLELVGLVADAVPIVLIAPEKIIKAMIVMRKVAVTEEAEAIDRFNIINIFKQLSSSSLST